MCDFESAVVVCTDGDIRVLSHPNSSSHSSICGLHKISERGFMRDSRVLNVELTPTDDLRDVDSYELYIDGNTSGFRPEWWDNWMEDKIRRELKPVILRKVKAFLCGEYDGILSFHTLKAFPADMKYISTPKSLTLAAMKSLPAGLESITCGGTFYVSKIRSLPANLRAILVSGDVYFPEVHTLPRSLTTLTVGGNFSAANLTIISSQLKRIQIRENFHAPSLIKFPEGLQEIEIRGIATLPALTRLPESLESLTIGGDAQLWVLKSFPKGLKNIRIGGICHASSLSNEDMERVQPLDAAEMRL